MLSEDGQWFSASLDTGAVPSLTRLSAKRSDARSKRQLRNHTEAPRSRNGTDKVSDDEIRRVGDVLIILTGGLKQFRLRGSRFVKLSRIGSALCASKLVKRLIAQRLPSVLFLPRVTR